MMWSRRNLLYGTSSAVFVVAMAGCASIAQIGNLEQESCSQAFTEAINDVLIEQGEPGEIAQTLALRCEQALRLKQVGPRPFTVAAPSGTDYGFVVQFKRPECVLRLYGRRKGLTSYTNNLTYIATRTLTGCSCGE